MGREFFFFLNQWMFPLWDKILWSTRSNGKYWSNEVIFSQTQIICFHQSCHDGWKTKQTSKASNTNCVNSSLLRDVGFRSCQMSLASDCALFSVKKSVLFCITDFHLFLCELFALPGSGGLFLLKVREVVISSSNMCSAPFSSSFWDSYNVKLFVWCCPTGPLSYFTFKNSVFGACGWLIEVSVWLLISGHVMILRVMKLSPTLSSALRVEPVEILPLLLPTPHPHSRSHTCAL